MITAEEWSHVAVTHGKSGDPQILINGKPVPTQLEGGGAPPPQTNDDISIGAVGKAFFVGDLDELMLYNRALSPQMIRGIYEASSREQ